MVLIDGQAKLWALEGLRGGRETAEIKMHCPEILANKTEAKYDAIFCDDPVKISNICKYLELSLRKKEELQN